MVDPYGLVETSGTIKPSYLSFQQFAQLSHEEPGVSVTDRFSVHWSDRMGHQVRYFIVHSTASPVGAPAGSTLRYLVGPNDRRVSAHELVLPGRRVYRMVPDEYAAHHCESATVHFPDGTPAHLANEITWGIEAYQVSGRPVGDEVLETTIERVAVACRRLGLGPEHVLGHREIDPERRQDPVGVEDMNELRAAVRRLLPESVALDALLLEEADANQVIQFNPNAALQRRIYADGFVPNSPEFDVTVGDVRYRVQRAEHLEAGKMRAYYAEVPRWDDVRFVERP